MVVFKKGRFSYYEESEIKTEEKDRETTKA